MAVGNGALAVEECPHRSEHGQIQADLDGLRRDEDRHEESIRQLFELARGNASGIASAAEGIARIEGSLEGAMRAKKVSGTILGIAVSVGLAGATAIGVLLLELIKRGS